MSDSQQYVKRDGYGCGACGKPYGQHYGRDPDAFCYRPGEQPSRVSTTCARCSATIDPAAAEQHHERCFVAGDWVRWWPDGEVDPRRYSEVCVADILNGSPYTAVIDSHGPRWSSQDGLNGQRVLVNRGTIRHIQRPGQSIVAIDHNLSPHATDAEIKALLEVQGGKVRWSDDLAPTLYDGLTAMECYAKWGSNRAAVECGVRPLYDLTPDQIAAGRRAYQMDALSEHADELRTRISAAKERERLSVTYCEVDVENEPW